MVLPLGHDGSKSGDAQPVTSGIWNVLGVDWTADGKELLFEGSAGSNNSSLWRVPRGGGKPVRLATPGMISGEPTVARQSGSVVYVAGQYETKIFKNAVEPARRLRSAGAGGRDRRSPRPGGIVRRLAHRLRQQ